MFLTVSIESLCRVAPQLALMELAFHILKRFSLANWDNSEKCYQQPSAQDFKSGSGGGICLPSSLHFVFFFKFPLLYMWWSGFMHLSRKEHPVLIQ